MSEKTDARESFEDFRKSFFYGSRSDMNFKFLDHMRDEQAAVFLQDLFKQVAGAIDSGSTDSLKQTMIEGQATAQAHQKLFSYEDGPFTPFNKDAAETKFTMLTSSGHFAASDDPEPFGVKDMSQSEAESRIMEFIKEKPVLSKIPFSIAVEDLRVRHGGYPIDATLEDHSVTFPWQRLNEFLAEGIIGKMTEHAYSFIGACSQKRLMKTVIPKWTDLMLENEVEGAILVPV